MRYIMRLPGGNKVDRNQGFEKVTPGNDLRGENPKWQSGRIEKTNRLLLYIYYIIYRDLLKLLNLL